MTRFYEELPRIADFDALVDPQSYVALPDDWLIGVTDVVDSTGAIAAGRYKTVNMAGATVIAALTNALPGRSFPFVFGGDGASFAIPATLEETARAILGQTIRFVEEALGLTLRAALVPVALLRAAGRDVRVARHAASRSVAYAMFRGGGLAFAEAAMKRGEHAVSPAAPGAAPDLTGLSCRWSPIPARHGVIASLIVLPARGEDARFQAVAHQILTLAMEAGQASRPVAAPEDIVVRWPPDGTASEALTRPAWRRVAWLVRLYLRGLIAFQKLIFARGWTVGAFDPARYRRDLVANADFRKYDDGLKLTLDCTPALAERLEALLAAAEREGVVRYGLHRQGAAIVTCFVPSASREDHVHFIDGADGGYAQAAQRLKRKAA